MCCAAAQPLSPPPGKPQTHHVIFLHSMPLHLRARRKSPCVNAQKGGGVGGESLQARTSPPLQAIKRTALSLLLFSFFPFLLHLYLHSPSFDFFSIFTLSISSPSLPFRFLLHPYLHSPSSPSFSTINTPPHWAGGPLSIFPTPKEAGHDHSTGMQNYDTLLPQVCRVTIPCCPGMQSYDTLLPQVCRVTILCPGYAELRCSACPAGVIEKRPPLQSSQATGPRPLHHHGGWRGRPLLLPVLVYRPAPGPRDRPPLLGQQSGLDEYDIFMARFQHVEEESGPEGRSSNATPAMPLCIVACKTSVPLLLPREPGLGTWMMPTHLPSYHFFPSSPFSSTPWQGGEAQVLASLTLATVRNTRGPLFSFITLHGSPSPRDADVLGRLR